MILKRFTIDSFAGLSDVSLEFSPGLTILSGPNEAGKSTVFHGIFNTLFTPSGIGKRQFESDLERFLPLAGGDTISCALEFDVEGPYVLERSWGGEKRDVLTLPDGGVLKESSEVSNTLRTLLPVSDGTMKNIFLVYQNGLERTLDELKSSPGTEVELGAVIRKSLFETGGLSVERFRKTLDERFRNYADRWDFSRGFPEKGRGIENPWKSGAGIIVKCWYDWKFLEAERGRAERVETKRAVLVEEYSETLRELEDVKAYLSEHRDAFEAMKKKESLAIRHDRAREMLERHRKAFEGWTKLETELLGERRELERLEAEAVRLAEEMKKAEKAVSARELKKRFEEMSVLKADMDRAAGDLASLPGVDRDTVSSLRSLEREAERLGNLLASGDLRLVLRGKSETHIRVKTGTGMDREMRLVPGGEERLAAGGYADLETDGFSVGISTGELDVASIRKQMEECTVRLNGLMDSIGVVSPEEAEKVSLRRAEAESRVEQTRSAFERFAGDDDFEETAAAARSCGEMQTRALKDILEDSAKNEAARSSVLEAARRREEEISVLGETYGDKDGAAQAFSKAALEAEKLEVETAACGTVPGGFEEPGAFVADYSAREERRRDLDEGWYRFRESLIDLEKELPEESEEELSSRCDDAREAFERALRRGRHIDTLRRRTERILDTLDNNTFGVYAGTCAAYMEDLTSGSYGGVELEGGLPAGIRGSGPTLPYTCLSAGTRDIFALAVRLAAADIFLGGRKGFLILDDPMVDLDAGRRKNAAAVIEQWARTRQVILFTCHPEYIDLFNQPVVIDMKKA